MLPVAANTLYWNFDKLLDDCLLPSGREAGTILLPSTKLGPKEVMTSYLHLFLPALSQ